MEAIKFITDYIIKEENIEDLDTISPWITVNVKDLEKAKELIKYRAVMIMKRGDLVMFQAITNVELRGYRTKVETYCKHAMSFFSTTCIYTYLLSQHGT